MSISSKVKAGGLLTAIKRMDWPNNATRGSSSPNALPPLTHGWQGGPAMYMGQFGPVVACREGAGLLPYFACPYLPYRNDRNNRAIKGEGRHVHSAEVGRKGDSLKCTFPSSPHWGGQRTNFSPPYGSSGAHYPRAITSATPCLRWPLGHPVCFAPERHQVSCSVAPEEAV